MDLKEIEQIRIGGGNGSIIGRNTFQRPKQDAISLLKEINTNCSKKNTLFILISKSGNTIETLSSINTLNKDVIDKKMQ